MTEAKRKTKTLLAQRNETFGDVARAAGLALATIHNVLDGKASSRKSQQAITNALGAEIWDGIWPKEHAFVMPVGGEIYTGGDESVAQQWCNAFPGRVERRGDAIYFTKRTALVIHEPDPEDDDNVGIPESLLSDEMRRKYGDASDQ